MNLHDVLQVVEQSCAYLRNHLKVEGLFRMSGGAAYINDLREEFDKGMRIYATEHAISALSFSATFYSFIRVLLLAVEIHAHPHKKCIVIMFIYIFLF